MGVAISRAGHAPQGQSYSPMAPTVERLMQHLWQPILMWHIRIIDIVDSAGRRAVLEGTGKTPRRRQSAL